MTKKDMPKSENEFREFTIEIVRMLISAIEEKDGYLKKHSERVADNCACFCEEFKLCEKSEIDSIYFAGLLHDIGKIATPLPIIRKPEEELDDEEKVVEKRHPITGEKILSNLSYFENILKAIRSHHEAFDGSGYPDGKNDDQIALGAKVIHLCSSFDGMVNPRQPAEGMPLDDALKHIENQSGKQFDPDLTEQFIQFAKSNSGKSENYLLRKETSALRNAFTEILQKFKAGKLSPPVMPQVVQDIQVVIKRSTSNVDEVAAVIERDPTISLRLISVANSPVYRGVQEIRNIRNALPRMGLKETLNLVIAISNKSLYETDRVQFKILMDKLWVHSLACAYSAKVIAQHLNLDDVETYFLMGLTHDIGKALLLKAFTDNTKIKIFSLDAILANIQEVHLSLGSLLLKRWGFSEEFIKVIANHEGGDFNTETGKDVLVLHLANLLTCKIGYSLVTIEDIDFEEVDSARLLNLDNDKLEFISQEVKTIISDVAHLF